MDKTSKKYHHNCPLRLKLIDYTSTLFPVNSTTVIDLRQFPLPVFSTVILKDEGIPENVLSLKKIIDEHDVFVISVAEHNHSVTAFFKNIIDWISKAQSDYKILRDKPVLLLSASPSPGGGKNAAAHAEMILKEIGGNVIAKFSLPSFYNNVLIDETGLHFKDELTTHQLTDLAAKLTT